MAVKKPEQKILPMLVHRGSIVFPENELPIEVGRAESIKALSLSDEQYQARLVYVCQKNPDKDILSLNEVYDIGTLVNFDIIKSYADGSKRINVKSVSRVKITKKELKDGCYFATYDDLKDFSSDEKKEREILVGLVQSIDEMISKAKLPNSKELKTILKEVTAARAVGILSTFLPMPVEKRQKLLEENDVTKRLEFVQHEITKDKSSINLEIEISDKINKKLGDQQREYLLREKLRTIKEELGELEGKGSEVDKLREKLNNNQYPEHIKKKINEELNRLEVSPPGSQEGNVIKTYVDWVLALPWWEETVDNIDLKKARATLDKNHSGLIKVKERIIEYLAIRTRNKKPKGPIICLVGPPGVGKTSLAKSIADALDKKFVKMALGGVRDEAEIRGHRKTYLGSQPGRILNAMKRAGVTNPLFLLDEIDKMSSDSYRGDPASAVLEVLDPEQNKYFSDNYIEENYDLSNVMFIATSNYIENIPEPLRDRMEIIQLSSYTEPEKLQIAKDHLVPKILEEMKIDSKELEMTDEAILYIVQRYTREAGVRELDRVINKICRKYIIDQNAKKIKKIKVTKQVVLDYVGKETYDYTMKDKKAIPGVVTGLAYTAYGGDILPIEATVFSGKGGLILTGKLGEVMKESASIALGYIKTNAAKFGLDSIDFSKIDIHLHAPEGAVPKDGPSAGVTLTTALISALTDRKVPPVFGMTGEITLRGLVLKIGGLREKLMSAYRSGLEECFIPKDNEKDLDEVAKEAKDKLKIHLIEKYDEIYDYIFGKSNQKVVINKSWIKTADVKTKVN